MTASSSRTPARILNARILERLDARGCDHRRSADHAHRHGRDPRARCRDRPWYPARRWPDRGRDGGLRRPGLRTPRHCRWQGCRTHACGRRVRRASALASPWIPSPTWRRVPGCLPASPGRRGAAQAGPQERKHRRDWHHHQGQEETHAVLRPGASRAGPGDRRLSRHRADADQAVGLRQRRDLRPVRGVGPRLRRLRDAEPHRTDQPAGSWSSSSWSTRSSAPRPSGSPW